MTVVSTMRLPPIGVLASSAVCATDAVSRDS